MTTTTPGEQAPPVTSHPTSVRSPARLALTIGALGVVFGDIGTSPIYTIQTLFNPATRIR
ncbi:KUP/HAK/KT family potassium transporter [Cellulomonas sp. Leaf395]|uniref:KUP/HAK/KT family potassium transporter n=1 Tax=Cellulomonas sp. Leaf395 TaxID=1736362 RepID=UPI0007015489|nr:KUP/HAK/KT family potassium transporter [Cellulomonas sp. Leaf395]KQS97346.1 hypothetical protein ASG23_17545 [Cellulomonas sp. Leaf395]